MNHWHVDINNTQRVYIVAAIDPVQAAVRGRHIWDNDFSVTKKQRDRGIYDIRIRPSKFGELMNQLKLPGVTLEDGKIHVYVPGEEHDRAIVP